MTAYQVKYDPQLNGAQAVYSPTIGTEQAATDFRNGATVYAIPDGSSFTLTGYYWVLDGYAYMQTTTGMYLSAHYESGKVDNWLIEYPFGNKAITYSQTQAQALVQTIIENNKTITRCNCLCARYAGNFSSEQLAQIKALQKRVVARDQALQDSGLTENVKTGYPEEYAELSPYLQKIMEDESIGVATWVVVVVIAATVIAATATAAYFAYKSLADESERDVKFSKELTASLVNKLSPEEYQQLLDETKGMLTKSKIKSLVRGSWGTLKYVAMAAGAYAIYKIIKSKL